MKRTRYRIQQYRPKRCSCGRAMSTSQILVGWRTLDLCQPCVDAWWAAFFAERAHA